MAVTYQWSKTVVNHPLGDKSSSTEAFNIAGLLCSGILHPTTSKLFLKEKHLVKVVCNLMKTSHKAVLQMVLRSLTKYFTVIRPT